MIRSKDFVRIIETVLFSVKNIYRFLLPQDGAITFFAFLFPFEQPGRAAFARTRVQIVHRAACSSSRFLIMIRTAETAPSVMPGMRPIWPMVAGAIRVSLACSSLDRPGTDA